MISIQDLSKSYGKLRVLSGLNLQISEPGTYALLGPNGSGKTTLMKMILGMVAPDRGSITVNKQPVQGAWKYRKGIDYMPQIANFPPNLKVSELFKLLQNIRKETGSCNMLAEAFGLEPYLDKTFSNLSGGTRQKVNVTASLMFDSPLVILDEPTTGLDPIAMITLKELLADLKAQGKTIVISSHIISFVEEVADEIIFILEGKIHFQGSQAELSALTHESQLERAIADLLRNQ